MVVDAASDGTIDPGSKADIRLAYQQPPVSMVSSSTLSLLLHLFLPLLWPLPLEDYSVGTGLSSPRVLSSSTRSGTEVSNALSSTSFVLVLVFSISLSLSYLTVSSFLPLACCHHRSSCISPSTIYFTLTTLPLDTNSWLSLTRGSFKTTRARDERLLPHSLYLSIFSHFTHLSAVCYCPFFLHSFLFQCLYLEKDV